MKKGFTLIEILVVVAIIAVLAAITVPNYLSARERARDAQRKSDLKQVQNALELYKDGQATLGYPAALPTPGQPFTGTDSDGGTITYLRKMPGDPIGTYPYVYNQTSNITYTLTACLENKNDRQGIPCTISCVSGGKCIQLNEP